MKAGSPPRWSRANRLWMSPGAMENPDERKSRRLPIGRRDKTDGQRSGRKRKKQAQAGLQRQRIEARDWLRWKRESSSAERTGLEKAEGSAHNPNINQQK